MSTQLPCVVCGVVPDSVDADTDYHPYGATEFVSYGHYGSTVWDPMDEDQTLVLNVCDSCLKLLHERLVERTRVRPPRSSYDHKAFAPYVEQTTPSADSTDG